MEQINSEQNMNGGQNVTVNKVHIGGKVKEITGPLTPKALDDIAKVNRISKYTVQTMEGKKLKVADFPYTGSVKIVEYNAAG